MLYRYIFKGLGWLIVIGMLTGLALAIYSQLHSTALSHPEERPNLTRSSA